MGDNSFSIRIDASLLAQFDALVGEARDKRNNVIRNLIEDYIKRTNAIVLGWLRVERQGEGEANQCAGCAQELDWERGVYAQLMSNGIVGSLHCAGCATHE